MRQFGLDKAQTDSDLLIVADKARFHDTRLAAAHKIQAIENADKCWRSMKTKDKVVARELKARLDQQREEQSAEASHNANIEKILSEMDKLANSVWQPGSVNRFDHFSSQWSQLQPSPTASVAEQFTRLYDKANQKAIQWRDKQSLEEQQQTVIDLSLIHISEPTRPY